MLLCLLAATAVAGPFTQKASMGGWPERQVERDFVLPKGWLQLQVAVDRKQSGSWRDADGRLEPYAAGTTWTYSRFWLRLDQGFSRHLRLYAHIPYVVAGLANDEGADQRTAALGDVHTGVWIQPWVGRAGKLAVQVDLKAPSGVEWPGNFIGGPDETEGFLTGTGITNLGGHLHGRLRLGRVASVDAGAGYVFKFPSVVGYVVEPDGFGNGWLDPGDELVVQGGLAVQVHDDVALRGFGQLSRRGTYALGNSGQSAFSLDLRQIPGTAGSFVDAGGALGWEPVTHLEIELSMSAQVLGDDTRTWAHLGLEEFSPQPGLTTVLEVTARW